MLNKSSSLSMCDNTEVTLGGEGEAVVVYFALVVIF